MPKYGVMVRRVDEYRLEVEAASEAEARAKVESMGATTHVDEAIHWQDGFTMAKSILEAAGL